MLSKEKWMTILFQFLRYEYANILNLMGKRVIYKVESDGY